MTAGWDTSTNIRIAAAMSFKLMAASILIFVLVFRDTPLQSTVQNVLHSKLQWSSIIYDCYLKS